MENDGQSRIKTTREDISRISHESRNNHQFLRWLVVKLPVGNRIFQRKNKQIYCLNLGSTRYQVKVSLLVT